MYISVSEIYLPLGPAPPHHHQGEEVQVECEVLLVLVWEGCHCTGPLFPILKDMERQEIISLSKI